MNSNSRNYMYKRKDLREVLDQSIRGTIEWMFTLSFESYLWTDSKVMEPFHFHISLGTYERDGTQW